jgi:hypothetical protein
MNFRRASGVIGSIMVLGVNGCTVGDGSVTLGGLAAAPPWSLVACAKAPPAASSVRLIARSALSSARHFTLSFMLFPFHGLPKLGRHAAHDAEGQERRERFISDKQITIAPTHVGCRGGATRESLVTEYAYMKFLLCLPLPPV